MILRTIKTTRMSFKMSDNHDLLNDNDMYSFSGYEADYMYFNNDIAIYGYRNDVHSMTENVAELQRF